ncbi:hypothetical protein SISSUDRAFT_584924 [Sistotremastrum suecicum HHB10207 ss-3]|uniref:Uncharacterized protein n=1 Tax=Sistotremastrum suecicum HHB10207 ss-3 TaxID=1314776 RepID=A0A165XEH4_9AGAM|nr:hypothetical protein SISSUDRAFT_584924 [Sistotremastrum suecicum HHB10207 ss-3]
MGGLGRIDSQWTESGWRMNEAFWRLRDGSDLSGTWSESFEYYAEWLAQARGSLSRWSEEKTEENASVLWKNLWLWSGSHESEQRLANPPPVGEIGYIKGEVWHPLPLAHQFPLADPPQYNNYAFRWRDGEWEQISGSRVKEFTRWSVDVAPGEEVYLHTSVRSYRSGHISHLFRACALFLARDFGVDVRSLRLVSRAGFYVDTSITRLKDQPSTMHYFSYPSNPDGSVPNPPGFWSFSPDPLCSDQSLQAQDAQAYFHM